jgi:polar amino acid transport system substrate-binding protein
MHQKAKVIIFSMILLWPLHGAAADRSVHLATLNWSPYIGERLEGYGFGAEILRTAFDRAGYDVTFSFMPWVRVLKDVEIGAYDAVCFAYYSKEREDRYHFTHPYAQSVLGFCKRSDTEIRFQSLQDLTPYRIGVVRGFVNTPQFDALRSIHKEEVKDELTNLKKLLNRRVDLIIIDKFVLQHLMNTHFQSRQNEVTFLDPPLITQPLYLMFSKQLPTAARKVQAFNQAIEEMKNDGTIETILNRFGYDYAE